MLKARHTTVPGRRFLSAEWRYLAMLNYAVDPDLLAPFVPQGTELDWYQGKTYVSIVGFMFLRTRVLGVPVPWHRDFEEVNLRFYVSRTGSGEARCGVAFIKELVSRPAVTRVARAVYNENYTTLPMRHQISGLDGLRQHTGQPSVSYEWKLNGRWQGLCMTCSGSSAPIEPGSHEAFLAENYYGYGTQRDGGTIEYLVEHPPWEIQPAEFAELNCDVEQLYGPQFAEVLSRRPDSAFLAEGSPVTVYRPARIC